ncbi:MAG: hypothetical protein RLZZ450_3407 [Pseudomonadota bacterium]
MREPGTSFPLAASPPPVGSCLGGSCASGELPSVSQSQPTRDPSARYGRSSPHRRLRFAYAGATLGVVTSALVLGGAIAIEAVGNDPHSERITRGVWLGTVAVSAPLIALSAHLARKASGVQGYQGVRRVGWLAYALSVSDGALLWAGAFNGVPRSGLLTVGAGVIGVFALLPQALDALQAGRALRLRRFMKRLHGSATGLRIQF